MRPPRRAASGEASRRRPSGRGSPVGSVRAELHRDLRTAARSERRRGRRSRLGRYGRRAVARSCARRVAGHACGRHPRGPCRSDRYRSRAQENSSSRGELRKCLCFLRCLAQRSATRRQTRTPTHAHPARHLARRRPAGLPAAQPARQRAAARIDDRARAAHPVGPVDADRATGDHRPRRAHRPAGDRARRLAGADRDQARPHAARGGGAGARLRLVGRRAERRPHRADLRPLPPGRQPRGRLPPPLRHRVWTRRR